jgi:hypothetical protein
MTVSREVLVNKHALKLIQAAGLKPPDEGQRYDIAALDAKMEAWARNC